MDLEKWLGGKEHLLFLQRARFGSQHTHGGSRSSITLVPRDSVMSFDLHRQQPHIWCTYIYTCIHYSYT